MREIDQMLKQWLPVNTIIRKQFRDIITKYIELRMIETFDDARRIYERNPDSGKIRSRELMDYGNEQMVNSIPDDGVCEGEYVHPREDGTGFSVTEDGTWIKVDEYDHPTQEEIIAFNVRENKNKEMYNRIKN